MDTKTNGMVKKIYEELQQTKRELAGMTEELVGMVSKVLEEQQGVKEELAMFQKKYGPGNSRLTKFMITPEEKTRIVLPDGKIGVNEFARCVNKVINPEQSKNLTGVDLNKQLKKMGILSEKELEEGKRRTVINDQSKEYGIETEPRSFNGTEYEKIVFNEKGKSFLLENLEKIMEVTPENIA